MSLELTPNRRILVFTDFDGTLLDHYSYSFEAAKPCIKRLSAIGIPIIPNTSKTLAEVSALQQIMGLHTPLIVENGAAIYMPRQFLPQNPRGAVWKNGYWIKSFAQKRQYWQGIVKKIQAEHEGEFETFGNMDIERISEVTGLDAQSALLASQRQFGEPILWKGSDKQRTRFIEKAKKLGAYPLLGGRFLHICGNSNKGKALLWLLNEYKRQHPNHVVSSVAIGDGKNDIDMLEVADTAVRITSPAHKPPKLERTHKVYTSVATGPQGWSEVMDQLIPDI
ncbi:MAG: mannosyl-3-phosphoglycerate phosphatase [Alphaproteobacteria bacterium]|jgi:mannosyl-3-phosphoglycerate phosphatase